MFEDVPPRVAVFRVQASDGPVHLISRDATQKSQFRKDSFHGIIDFLEYHSLDAEFLSSYRVRVSSGLADEFDLSLLNSNGLFALKNAAEA